MTNPAPSDPKSVADCPRSLEAAVESLLRLLSPQDRAIIAALPETGLEELNRYDLGARIRKEFGLWRGNRALMAACGALNPEDTSMAIIREAWNRVRREDGHRSAQRLW